MRTLVIAALTLMLAGCNGDRLKQGMNSPYGQPENAAALLIESVVTGRTV
jgi:hypothetical protein